MIILNGKDITELKTGEITKIRSLDLAEQAKTLVKKITSGATLMKEEIASLKEMIGATADSLTSERHKPE